MEITFLCFPSVPFSVTTLNSSFSRCIQRANIAPNKVELLLWLLLGYKLLHACRHFFLNCFSLFVNEILLWDSVNSSFLIFTDLPMSRKTSFVNLLCLKELFSSIIRIIAWRSFLLLSSVLFSCFFFVLIGCSLKVNSLDPFFYEKLKTLSCRRSLLNISTFLFSVS